jgi:hypothetical protein
MPWNGAFISMLQTRRIAPIFLLRVHKITDEACDPSYQASSIPLAGYDPIVRNCRVSGSSLSPQARSATVGGFSVDLHGNLSLLLASIKRGTIVSVWLGFPGWSLSSFERICLGQVSGLRKEISGQSYLQTLDCVDLLSALRSRIGATSSQLALFYGISSTSNLGAAYAVGDSSLTVGATGSFERETGGKGAILLGDFYLLWSSATSTVFTIHEPSVEHHGTTRAAVASGQPATEIARLYGHPIDIFRKVCLSTGAGSNGAYDTLPVSWGLGLPQDFLAEEDMQQHRLRVDSLTSPGFNLEILVTEEQTDPLSWMQGWLSACGLFITMVQGQLTCRALQTSYDTSTVAVRKTSLVIGDDDIQQVVWEAWDPETPAEFAIASAHTGSSVLTASSTLENDTSLPARYRAEFDLSDLLFENESAIATEIVQRCAESAGTRIPERISLTVGLVWAMLAPGDIVTLDTRRITGRFSYNSAEYKEVPVVVIQVSPDWMAGLCKLVVLCYPSGGDAFP